MNIWSMKAAGFLSSVISPADEVDDGFVLQFRVCCARTSSFVCQLHNLIFVGELLAHLTAACGRAGFANSYNKIIITVNSVWKQQDKDVKILKKFK